MSGPGSSPSNSSDLAALRAMCAEAMSNLPAADDVYAEKVAPGVVLALIEYVEANEAYVSNSFLVFERRADSASLASPLLRFEAARSALGLTKKGDTDA